jgi:hypothetical protein
MATKSNAVVSSSNAKVIAQINGVHANNALKAAPIVAPTTISELQQATLDVLRYEKAKAIVDAAAPKVEVKADVPVAPVTPEPAAANVGAVVDETQGQFIQRMLDSLPSGKRAIASLAVSVLLSAGAGYGIGTIAGYAIVGVAALSGALLWQWVIFILAIALGAYVGMKIGQHVGNYILSGQIDKDAAACWDTVTGWFSSKDKVAEVVAIPPLGALAA